MGIRRTHTKIIARVIGVTIPLLERRNIETVPRRAHGYDHQRSFASVAGKQESLARGYRETYGTVAMLHLPCRERSHSSGHRDFGEASTGVGSASLSTLLRRRRAAQAAEPAEKEDLGRHRMGK